MISELNRSEKKDANFFSVLLRLPVTLKNEVEQVQVQKGFSTRTQTFVFVLLEGLESLKRQQRELENQFEQQQRQTQQTTKGRSWHNYDV